MAIKILGIDPSLSNTGLVLAIIHNDMTVEIKDMKLVETEATKSKTVRVNSSDLDRARLISVAIKEWEPLVDIVAVEVPVGSQSARAMASYGVCIGFLAGINAPLIQLTPNQVKIAATGDKLASKQDMISWATTRHPKAPWLRQGARITNKNEHLADAVGAIYAAIQTDDFKLVHRMNQAILNSRSQD